MARLARGVSVFIIACGGLTSLQAAAEIDGLNGVIADALDLDQQARAIEDSAAANNAVEFYLGNRDDSMLLRYVRVQIDDRSAVQYEYSEAEANATARGAMQRLFTAALTPGTHRVRIEYTARSQQRFPEEPLLHSWLDQKIELSTSEHWLAAEMFKPGMMSNKPVMKLALLSKAGTAVAAPMPIEDGTRSVAAATPGIAFNSSQSAADVRRGAFEPGSDEDPRVRYSRFLLAEDRSFDAAAELLHVQASAGNVALPASFAALLAPILADLGQSARLQIAAAPADAALIAGSGATVNDFTRYQAAAQRVAEGHADLATADLDQLGQIKPLDDFGWALRDQANLSLGYAQLHSGQAAAAINTFGRVRAQGPFSARALLGQGWAFLDSAGEAATANAAAGKSSGLSDSRPAFIGDIDHRQGRKIHYSLPSPAQLESLRRALVPWTELIGRNPMDPAVQEGLVAIGYALDHTGAFDEAQRFYNRSVKLQETTLIRLASAQAQVNDGRMLGAVQRGAGSSDSGWHWQLPAVVDDSHWWLTLNDVPAVPDNFYFDELIAEPNFTAALRQYRQVQDLILACDTHLQALSGLGGDSAELQQRLQALKSQLLGASATAGEQLKTVALADLQQQQKQAQAYLVEARFALARSNDWAPTELAHK
jgi:tetratricopeptide (TPR) repeat protein